MEPTIVDFLVWLSGGIGATLVASYIAERWQWFQEQTPNVKTFLKTVVASVIAVAAFVTYTYVPAEVWIALAPYWQLILGVVATNYGVEIFHWFDKRLVK
jgi:uncharacterized membrane-anchored protein